MLYLLCQIANGTPSPGTCEAQSGAGSPVGVATPEFVGQLYHDTTADTYYRSTGLTAADWAAIGSASSDVVLGSTADVGIILDTDNVTTSVSIPSSPVSNFGIVLNKCSKLTSFSAPAISSVGIPSVVAITVDTCPLLTSFLVPSLTTIFGNLQVTNCPSIGAIDIPNVTTIFDGAATGGVFTDNDVSLVTFNCPQWIPTNGQSFSFVNCALNVSSVELILRRCVLAGVTTCTIDLSGGTNAGTASLSAQGQADVATLGAQVTMNP